MGNKIRIKQIDLQGIISASGQVSLLSASNYVSFVTQLDTTMSSDSELAAASSSISQSIYTINRTLGSGLISGSSQLTSSYDTRYVLSGSITQTTWDNIDGKPSGLVSQSTDLTPLTSKTGSYATTGSNQFDGNQTITGSIIATSNIQTVNGYVQTNLLYNGGPIEIRSFYQPLQINSNGAGTIVNDNTDISGSLRVSGSIFSNGIGLISGSSQLTSSYDSRYVLSGSITQTTWDNIANKPSDIVSSSTQISNLGFVTGSYTTINSFNSLTQSFNSISQSFNVISGSVGTIDFSTLATTSSLNTFTSSVNSRLNNIEATTSSYETKGSGIISGSSQLNNTSIENLTIINLTTVNETASVLFSSGSNRFGDFGNDIHSFTGSVQISGSTIITGSVSATSFNGTINATNGVVSGSSQITAFGFISSSTTIPTGTISGSSQLTSSFDTRYTLSGSISAVPSGTISGSSQLTSSFDTRYSLSGSSNINTSSFATTGSNSFSGSQTITGSLIVSAIAVVSGGINVPTGSVLSLTSGSSISIDSSGAITGSLTGSVFGIGDVVAFSASLNSRIISGSAIAGTISGSSQLTSSYDSRYSLSGSVLTSFSSSVDSRLDTLEASIITGSPNYVQVLGDRRTGITTIGVSIISGSITTNGNPVQIMVTGDANPVNVSSWTRLQIFRNETAIGNIVQVENSSNLNVPYCLNVIDTPSAGTYSYSMRTVSGISGLFDFGESMGPTLTAVELNSKTSFPSGTISGSSQLTSSFDTRYTLSGSVQPLPSNLISGSSQLTSSFEVRGSGIYSSSAQLPNGLISGSSQLPSGLISGSSQLTSSYDSRYTLSGSVVGGTTPAGTISGSSQLTSSFDGRYTLTSSFNSFTASAQAVTTGSNSFNGTQIITGSLIITSGSFVGSQILANTSSLYLTSGSNLYVQNNGLVEITGSLRVSGSTISLTSTVLQVGTGSGDEGGEILLAKSAINNSLTGSGITIDSYQNRLRIFEQGGNARGVHIDLTKTPEGVAGELLWKASGIVNAGTFVTLDNLKATVTSSSNRGLSLATVAGTVTGYVSGHYQGITGASAGTSSTTSLSTSATTSLFGWNFASEGDMSNYILRDNTNNRVYRIIMIIGAAYNSNFISIERLH